LQKDLYQKPFKEGFGNMVKTVLALLLAIAGSENKPQSYEEAMQQAEKEKKPILILVGAKWCASCEVMKRDTIEPMKADGELKDVVVTYIDKDERPELAQQLMKGETLPQIVVFSKEAEQWKRLSLTGMQTRGRMQELLARTRNAVGQRILR
jgi:thiol:disulfide interchange protein